MWKGLVVVGIFVIAAIVFLPIFGVTQCSEWVGGGACSSRTTSYVGLEVPIWLSGTLIVGLPAAAALWLFSRK